MMKPEAEKLYDSITEVKEEYIEEMQTVRLKSNKTVLMRWGALAACFCLIAVGAAVWMNTQKLPERPEQESSVTVAPDTTTINEGTTVDTTPPSEEVTTTVTTVTTTAEETTPPTTEAPQTEKTTVTTTEAPPPTEKTTTTAETTTATTTTTEKTTASTTKVSPPTVTPLKADPVLLAEPFYPEMPMYPSESNVHGYGDAYMQQYNEWAEERSALRNQPEGYKDGFDTFFLNTAGTFLAGAGNENRVYSPLSLFMALSLSAEITDGNTRKQILNVLEQDSIETLRSHAKSIWQANYMDDGMAKCVLANSLWTNNGISYNLNTVDSVAENYYSSVYSGNPSTEEYNKLMQDWLNVQTDGLLEDYVSDIKMNPETVLMIASTVNFSGKWRSWFLKDKNTVGTFHSPTGDISCEFMNTEWETTYFWGDKFASIILSFENNGQMRLLLPDEGVSPDELLNDEEVLKYMTTRGWDYENKKYLIVNMSIPKFDISSSTDLTDGLKELGITDAFDFTKSDFSPLTDDVTALYISGAEQDARVVIDEEGCKASALTAMMVTGTAMPPDEYVDFIVDRPFIFEIVSDTGLPLFVGIVNDPNQ